MKKEEQIWYSQALQKEMPIAVYGHYGFSLLLIPTAAADYLEYERFQLIESIRPQLEAGKLKVFSINSINTESWMHPTMEGAHKAIRHNQFNQYVLQEVIPFIHQQSSPETPIYAAGASFGAFHSMNLYMKYPHVFAGVLAMSGVYELTEYSRGYFDDQVYFNSPMHFLPHLNDHGVLEQIRKGKVIIASGQGDHEDPEGNRRFSSVLNEKSLPHELHLWAHDIHHDWPTWRMMLPHFLDTSF